MACRHLDATNGEPNPNPKCRHLDATNGDTPHPSGPTPLRKASVAGGTEALLPSRRLAVHVGEGGLLKTGNALAELFSLMPQLRQGGALAPASRGDRR